VLASKGCDVRELLGSTNTSEFTAEPTLGVEETVLGRVDRGRWVDDAFRTVEASLLWHDAFWRTDRAVWAPPRLSESQTYPGNLVLEQRGYIEVEWIDFRMKARRFEREGTQWVAYWDFTESRRIEPGEVVRLRYFDPSNRFWPQVDQALRDRGLQGAPLEGDAALEAGMAVALELHLKLD
jgi:hypothetical protein